jgi:putative transposase
VDWRCNQRVSQNPRIRTLGIRIHAGTRSRHNLSRNITYEISAILKAIKEPVGRSAVSYLAQHSPEWLPRITRQRGTRTERLFWQSGEGFDRNIWEPRALLSMIDYIHMNPVRRGLVARSIAWRWSSAGWFESNPTCDLIPDRIPPEWISPG